MKVGDIVQLQSGGPLMTVESPMIISGKVGCAWFDGGEVRRDSFPEGALLRWCIISAQHERAAEI
jgi:uncharacterized protein YodC (DUF2158 family)